MYRLILHRLTSAATEADRFRSEVLRTAVVLESRLRGSRRPPGDGLGRCAQKAKGCAVKHPYVQIPVTPEPRASEIAGYPCIAAAPVKAWGTCENVPLILHRLTAAATAF